MKIWAGSTLVFILLCGLLASAQPVSPQIQCQITLNGWCIANVDGRIDMTSDEHNGRIWTVQDRLYMPNGPLRIVERTKNCAAGKPLVAKKLYERVEGASLLVAVSLTEEENCTLVFQMPTYNGAVSEGYRRAMRFQIMIAGRQIAAYDH